MIGGTANKIVKAIKKSFWPIYVLAAATFFLQLPFLFGEDITNARNNYLTGAKTDFWGGTSTLIYSHVPNIGFRWQIWLAIVQISFTAIGLLLVFHKKSINRLHYASKLAMSYSALLFGSQMTRDGLQFSLLIFGFGLFHVKSTKVHARYLFSVSFFFIILAMSLRPWMAIAIAPIVLLLFQQVKFKSTALTGMVIVISIATAPIAVDLSSTKILELQSSYPQQMVMMMDLAATHCYSNNETSVIKSKEGMSVFTSNRDYLDSVCQIYRPDTWESLTQAGHASERGISTDFWLIDAGNTKSYEKLKSTWLNLILSDPVTYLQNKILFMGKLMIGSDSRTFGFSKDDSASERFKALYKLPYDIAISLHLYSIIFCVFVLLLLPIRKFVRDMKLGLVLDSATLTYLFSLFLWTFLSAIAYIASNGRYTYSLSLLCIAMYLGNLNKAQSPSKHK